MLVPSSTGARSDRFFEQYGTELGVGPIDDDRLDDEPEGVNAGVHNGSA